MPLILFACKTLVKLCTNQLSNTIFTCLTITQPANSNFNSIKYTERKIIATRATRRKLSLSRHFFFLRRGLRLAPKKKKKKSSFDEPTTSPSKSRDFLNFPQIFFFIPNTGMLFLAFTCNSLTWVSRCIFLSSSSSSKETAMVKICTTPSRKIVS